MRATVLASCAPSSSRPPQGDIRNEKTHLENFKISKYSLPCARLRRSGQVNSFQLAKTQTQGIPSLSCVKPMHQDEEKKNGLFEGGGQVFIPRKFWIFGAATLVVSHCPSWKWESGRLAPVNCWSGKLGDVGLVELWKADAWVAYFLFGIASEYSQGNITCTMSWNNNA
jgi:hypothetical protein